MISETVTQWMYPRCFPGAMPTRGGAAGGTRKYCFPLLTLLAATALCLLSGRPAVAQQPDGADVADAFGIVVDTSGKPVAGAEVRCFRLVPLDEWHPRPMPALQRVTTGRDGTFRLDAKALTGGSGWIPRLVAVAEREGFGVGCTYWPWQSRHRRRIVLPAADKISGVVVDEAGEPLAGAQVGVFALRSPADPRMGYVIDVPRLDVLQTRTDAGGCFVIDRVPAGASAELIGSFPGHATIRTWKPRAGVALQFAAGQTGVKLVLPPEGTLAGTVRHAKTGEPLRGVPLVLHGEGNGAASLAEQATVSTADGTFRFGRLAAGRYAVRIPAAKGRTPEWRWCARPVKVSLAAGASVEGLAVEAVPGGTLEVQAVAVDGKTLLPGCWVTVEHNETHQQERVETGEKGVGWLLLLPGEYSRKYVSRDGYTAGRTSERDRTFRTEEGKTSVLRVVMEPLQSISGTVTATDGAPIQGATVWVLPYMGSGPGITDAEGRFIVRKDLRGWNDALKPVYLVARHEMRNAAACTEITKDTQAVDLVLRPGLIVSGRVVDPDGAPIRGAAVSVMLRGEHWSSALPGARTVSGEDGSFELRAIPCGQRYMVYAWAEGYGSHYHGLAAEQTTGKRLQLPDSRLKRANLSVSGVVVNEAGEPLAGFRVYLYGQGQPPRSAQTTDAEGRFEFRGICTGDVQLSASGPPTAAAPVYGSARAMGGATDVRIVVRARATATPLPDLSLPKLGEDFKVDQAHYWNDFEKPDALGDEWSRRETLALPGLDTTVLGKFGNEPLTLSLGDLPEHRFVRIYFDLYTLQSWDGDDKEHGPDLWEARIGGGPRLVYASLATGRDRKQSYPLSFGLLSAPGLAGGRRARSRLPWYDNRTWSSHAVYPMCFTVPHTAETIRLQFIGIGLQGLIDESWALDNVGVALLKDYAAKKLTDEELDKAWQSLSSEDVVAVYKAVQSLVASGDQGASYLIGKLGWVFEQDYRNYALDVTHVLESDDRWQWGEAGHELRGCDPRVWPLTFSRVDKRRFGANPPPWLGDCFDRWDVKGGPPEFLRHARAARVLELIWTEKARRALLFE